jgi:hypothetical protein
MPLKRMSLMLGRALALMLFSAALQAQVTQPEPKPAQPSQPTVTFTFDWASVQPHHYVISVDNAGTGSYESLTDQPDQPSGEVDSYTVKFTVTAATRDRIFTLARQLNYFNGDFEFHKSQVAATGQKILAYADSTQHHQTRYNWSENSGIEALTALFQGISATIESGRRLIFLRRFDKLGLNEELKGLERLAADHYAQELEIIVPTLQQIAEDTSIMNIARQRARHLLEMAGTKEQAAGSRQ